MNWVDQPVWPGHGTLRKAVRSWQEVLAYPGCSWAEAFSHVEGMGSAGKRIQGGCTPVEAVAGSEAFIEAAVSTSDTVPVLSGPSLTVTSQMLTTLRAQLGMSVAGVVAAAAVVGGVAAGQLMAAVVAVLVAVVCFSLAALARNAVRNGEVALVLLCADATRVRQALSGVARLDRGVAGSLDAYESGAGLREAVNGGSADVQSWAQACGRGASWNADGASSAMSKVMLWMLMLGPAVIGAGAAGYVLAW